MAKEKYNLLKNDGSYLSYRELLDFLDVAQFGELEEWALSRPEVPFADQPCIEFNNTGGGIIFPELYDSYGETIGEGGRAIIEIITTTKDKLFGKSLVKQIANYLHDKNLFVKVIEYNI